MCYSYKDYRREEETRRKREELRKQRGERVREAQKKFANRERVLVKS